MPWGHPDSREALWCVPCGRLGVEWAERMRLLGDPPPPTPRVRCCPACAAQGWRLVGAVEPGQFYLRSGRGREAVA